MRDLFYKKEQDSTSLGKQVTAEIEQAVHLHKYSNQQVHGIIIGLDKYRKLKEHNNQKASLPGSYNGMPIIVDSTEVLRIAVF